MVYFVIAICLYDKHDKNTGFLSQQKENIHLNSAYFCLHNNQVFGLLVFKSVIHLSEFLNPYSFFFVHIHTLEMDLIDNTKEYKRIDLFT